MCGGIRASELCDFLQIFAAFGFAGSCKISIEDWRLSFLSPNNDDIENKEDWWICVPCQFEHQNGRV